MLSEARQKKIREKLNRAQKCSILGPQNLGSGGGLGPRAPPGSAPEKNMTMMHFHRSETIRRQNEVLETERNLPV